MNKKGFTLTEIIAVIVIIGIIIIIAIPVSRRIIKNNQQEKINEKEKIVEKAMFAYAETDKYHYSCVMMTVQELINNGYVKDSDLGTTEKYSDKNKTWYYYKGVIQESAPTGVSCSFVSSNDSSGFTGDDDQHIGVTVPGISEKIKFSVEVTRNVESDFPSQVGFNPKVNYYLHDARNAVVDSGVCNSATCEIEVNIETVTKIRYIVHGDTNGVYYKTIDEFIDATEENAYKIYELEPKTFSLTYTKWYYLGNTRLCHENGNSGWCTGTVQTYYGNSGKLYFTQISSSSYKYITNVSVTPNCLTGKVQTNDVMGVAVNSSVQLSGTNYAPIAAVTEQQMRSNTTATFKFSTPKPAMAYLIIALYANNTFQQCSVSISISGYGT